MKSTPWTAILALIIGLTAGGGTAARAAEGAPLTEREKAAHALNRLGYGPRPGELNRVTALGVENWIRTQLEPAKIADPAAEAIVGKLTYIQKTAEELAEAYRAEVRARNLAQKARAAAAKAEEEMNMAPPDNATMGGATMGDEVTGAVKKKNAARLLANPGPTEEELVVAQALGELHHAKLARAVFSERQLEQVLVDFWFNHFNVDARKQQVRAMVVSYEQDVIRPNIWGSFRDLLGATAKSPAMLVYLDNWRSSVAYEPGPREIAMAKKAQVENLGIAPAVVQTSRRGLNENYGRELMELHTLGVDAGYTQKDVQEVARAFTGWSLARKSGSFQFITSWHDQGAKTILGKTFPAGGGQKDGEQVLDLLANHPATARHIAYKLCQRFVADAPPEDMVKRVAAAFTKSGGNLRATYSALFTDPKFFAPEFYSVKTKSPFEFVASSLRASGADFVEVTGLPPRIPLRALEAGALLGRGGDRLSRVNRKTVTMHMIEMGQNNYGWGPPTGFPEDSSTWVSSGALVSRLNYALALTGGQVADARVHPGVMLGDKDADMAEEAVDALSKNLFARPLSEATRRVVLGQSVGAVPAGATPVADLPRVLALILGAPEFQRR